MERAVTKETMVDHLAAFAVESEWDDLTPEVRERLKISILDSLACGIGGLEGEPVRKLGGYLAETGGSPVATLIGGGKTSADRAALFNGAAIRYLDYNDTFAAKGESCHPSDNLAPVLAVCEQVGGSGRDLLVALAVAYQVQGRLGEVAPVRAKGFDHTVLGMLGMASGASHARRLDRRQAANAIAVTGTAFNALRVTRTGALSHWKGLAAPNAAFGSVHAVALAANGITGPEEMFEGNKGLIETITGPFEVEWNRGDFSRVLRCSIKKYNAEFHSQTAIAAALEMASRDGFDAAQIESVHIETFSTGFHIIGGGEEGDKKQIRTREDADHSLPYIVAAAFLDREVTPAQYTQQRIESRDIRNLIDRVNVTLNPNFSERFPDEMPTKLRVRLVNGPVFESEASSYHGFFDDPFDWSDVCAKFDDLTAGRIDSGLGGEIREAVGELDQMERISTLTKLLGTEEAFRRGAT